MVINKGILRPHFIASAVMKMSSRITSIFLFILKLCVKLLAE